MAKFKVISLRETWWVWLNNKTREEVGSKQAAIEKLLKEGCKLGDISKRHDHARAIVEILWDMPLEEGESYHKAVLSPARLVLHGGNVRCIIDKLTPSRLASMSKSWLALEPDFPAWWPKQYHAAINDPKTLILRGKKPVIDQLKARWP
jgi:hypothetical protein